MQEIPANDPYVAVYRERPDVYQELVAAEDADGRLIGAIQSALGELAGTRIVEAGAGTGRVTRQLLSGGARVQASDAAAPMLDVARGILQAQFPSGPWELQVADARELPYGDRCADAAVAGWVLGHFTAWFADAWQTEIARALREMQRVVEPGGKLLIIETMGTGTDGPGAPSPGLERYYQWMEALGFRRQVIPTDYEFASVERAGEVCGIFFGAEMAERIRARGWSRVPEWTGLWCASSHLAL